MPTYYWKGNTVSGITGITGYDWGFTANWLGPDLKQGLTLPAGGDAVIFGASANANCLVGGFVNGSWSGYTPGTSFGTGSITLRIEALYGPTFPNNITQIGYSFGDLGHTFSGQGGPLRLNAQYIHIGTTAGPVRTTDISVRNIPSVTSYVQMDGPTANFYTEGTWYNVIMSRGNIETRGLTANLVSIEGVRSTGAYPFVATDGYGVGRVAIGDNSNINSVVVNAKATSQQIVINTVPKSGTINAMGITGTGHTFTTIQQNFRPAGLEKSFNEINKTLKYRRE